MSSWFCVQVCACVLAWMKAWHIAQAHSARAYLHGWGPGTSLKLTHRSRTTYFHQPYKSICCSYVHSYVQVGASDPTHGPLSRARLGASHQASAQTTLRTDPVHVHGSEQATKPQGSHRLDGQSAGSTGQATQRGKPPSLKDGHHKWRAASVCFSGGSALRSSGRSSSGAD